MRRRLPEHQHSDPLAARQDKDSDAPALRVSRDGIGSLLKYSGTDIESSAATLRRVAKNDSALDPHIVSQLLTKDRSTHNPIDLLTQRAREVIELSPEDARTEGIEERLVITGTRQSRRRTSPRSSSKLDLRQNNDDHRHILAIPGLHGAEQELKHDTAYG